MQKTVNHASYKDKSFLRGLNLKGNLLLFYSLYDIPYAIDVDTGKGLHTNKKIFYLRVFKLSFSLN